MPGAQTLPRTEVEARDQAYEGANNCTIELSHGGLVHVAHSEGECERLIRAASAGFEPLVVFRRMKGDAARQDRGFPEVRLMVAHIVGVFPLRSRSER